MTALRTLDLDIFRAINTGFRSVPADLLFALLSTSAIGWLQFLLTTPFAIRASTRNAALRHMMILLLSAIGPALKNFVPRDRPSRMLWVHEQESFYSGSFPSGHTTLAFAVAFNAILTLRSYRRLTHWPLFVAWAGLVGVSRMYRGVHWPSDVLGGACLGTLLACALDLVWPKAPPATPEPQPATP